MFKGISLWMISDDWNWNDDRPCRQPKRSWNRRKSGDAARSLQVGECTNRTLLLFNVRKSTTFLIVPHSVVPQGETNQ